MGYWAKNKHMRSDFSKWVSSNNKGGCNDKSQRLNKQEAGGCWLVSGPLRDTLKSPVPSGWKSTSYLNVDIRQNCQHSLWVLARNKLKKFTDTVTYGTLSKKVLMLKYPWASFRILLEEKFLHYYNATLRPCHCIHLCSFSELKLNK